MLFLFPAFEGLHRPERLFVFEGLDETQHNHCDGDKNEDVRALETGQRAVQRNQRAGSRNDRQTERIDFAAGDKRFQTFLVELSGHGRSLLEATSISKIHNSYIL